MKRFLMGTAATFVVSTAMATDDPKKQDPPKPPATAEKPAEKKPDDDTRTPMEKFIAAKKKLDEAAKKFQAAIKVVQDKGDQPSLKDPDIKATYEAQNLANEEVNKNALEAAKAEPKSKDGADALFFVAQRMRPGTNQGDEVIGLMIEHHVNDARMSQQMMNWSYGSMTPAMQKTLEAIETKATAKENIAVSKLVQGKLFLKSQSTAERGEKLLESVLSEFKDVSVSGRPIAKSVEGDLFEYRNLSIGKTVPEVEGEDIDGSKFKISDYRGKVVMIDFWGHW